MPIEELMRERFPLLDGFTHEDVNPLKRELEAALKPGAEPVGGYQMPDARVTDRVIGGPHGAIPIRVYAPPTRSGPDPELVSLPGGAFVRGDLDMPEAGYAPRELIAVAPHDGPGRRLGAGNGRQFRCATLLIGYPACTSSSRHGTTRQSRRHTSSSGSVPRSRRCPPSTRTTWVTPTCAHTRFQRSAARVGCR